MSASGTDGQPHVHFYAPAVGPESASFYRALTDRGSDSQGRVSHDASGLFTAGRELFLFRA